MPRSITPPPSVRGTPRVGSDDLLNRHVTSLRRSPSRREQPKESSFPGTVLLLPTKTAALADAERAALQHSERRSRQKQAMIDSLAAREGGITPRILLYPRHMERVQHMDDDSTLDVSDQELTGLPFERTLESFSALLANSNRIESLEAEALRRFAKLRVLQLRDNRLRELPEALDTMSMLIELDVSGNLLQALPASLGRLRALATLIVSRNQLTTLPKALAECTSLVELDARDNPLVTLPAELGNLPLLSMLDVSGGRLSSVPRVLYDLPTLTDFRLGRNPLTPTAEGVHRSEGAIFRFVDPQAIYDQLKPVGGDKPSALAPVMLVRATWLVARADALVAAIAAGVDEGTRKALLLPRRQEMPPEAFVHEEELRALVPESARGRLAVISISHCWRSPTNPDPDGATLLSVGSLFRERERMRGGASSYAYWPEEAGVFLDWCSLVSARSHHPNSGPFASLLAAAKGHACLRVYCLSLASCKRTRRRSCAHRRRIASSASASAT